MTRHYQIWVMLPVGSAACETYFNQSEALTQIWVVTLHQYRISALVSQTSIRGKPLVASRNVVCFVRLVKLANKTEKTFTTLSQMLKANDSTMRDTCHTFVPYIKTAQKKSSKLQSQYHHDIFFLFKG